MISNKTNTGQVQSVSGNKITDDKNKIFHTLKEQEQQGTTSQMISKVSQNPTGSLGDINYPVVTEQLYSSTDGRKKQKMKTQTMTSGKTEQTQVERECIKTLKYLEEEIQHKFDSWDMRTQCNLQPVPIQDLDFWADRLRVVIDKMEAQN
jgi:hypothetical protein